MKMSSVRKEKVDDTPKRRTLPAKAAVADVSPLPQSSAESMKTVADGSHSRLLTRTTDKTDALKERNKLPLKSEPTSGIKTRQQQQQQQQHGSAAKADPKSGHSDTPRRKSEFTVSRPLVAATNISPIAVATRRSAADMCGGTPDCFGALTFDTPASRQKLKRSSGDVAILKEDGELETHSSSVTVAVRVRPFILREASDGDVKNVVSMVDNETLVTTEKGDVLRFTYDYSFWSFDQSTAHYASQLEVYQAIGQPLLSKVLEGYNACLLAYGQTGSGKSYSMMGQAPDSGIIPQFCDELITRINSTTKEHVRMNLEISFFEIYNEKIHDLLGPSSTKDKSSAKKPNLKVREHPVLGPYVEGLSSYVVTSYEDISTWLSVGNKRRATAATGMNDTSSRSHSVFTMLLTRTTTETIDGESHEHNAISKINLVDLAGSERQVLAKTSGDRLREGVSINKSLHMLGKVISLLAEQSTTPASKRKKLYIPYRDSVLTWLLKESLGGNSQTSMLATISPSNVHVEDTLSTLRYAKQARTIVNIARVNEDPTARLIRVLREQVEKLKQQTCASAGDDVILESHREIAWLRQQLMLKESEMTEMKRAWLEKQLRSEEHKLEESRLLEKEGISVRPGGGRPKLVNLAENPQLSETLEYELRDGLSRVGHWTEDSSLDILLRGPLIADNHCELNYAGSAVILTVTGGTAQTFVNGNLITQPTSLHHGDRVILGDHYFRFCNPLEQSSSQTSEGHQLRDFEFARQELAAKQNARLAAQLELERVNREQQIQSLHQQQMETERDMNEVLAQALETAEAQRQKYEDRLQELESMLTEHRLKAAKSEQSRLETATKVESIEAEKRHLVNELGFIRAQLDTKSPTTQTYDGDTTLPLTSTFLEKMTRLKENFQLNMVQLERKREMEKKSSQVTDLHRLMQMIGEANSISQHLQKHTTFSRDLVTLDNGQSDTVVRVTRTDLNISTVWSVEKLEERLVTMRQLYEDPDDDIECSADDIFYDPEDAWEADLPLNASKILSPRLMNGLRRQSNIGPLSAPTSSCEISYLSQSILEDIAGLDDTVSAEHSTSSGFETTVFDVCQQLIRSSSDQIKDISSCPESCYGDRVLASCLCIMKSMHCLRQAYDEQSPELFCHSPTCIRLMIQLQSAFSALTTVISLWAMTTSTTMSSLGNSSAAVVMDIFQSVSGFVQAIGSKLLLLTQGCQQGIKTMVNESYDAIKCNVLTVCQLCGKVSLSCQQSMHSFSIFGSTADSELHDDVESAALRVSLHGQFLSGCDQLVGQSLHSALLSVEDSEMRIIDCSEERLTRSMRSPSVKVSALDDLLRLVQMPVACTRLLLQKLQAVQAGQDYTTTDDEDECHDSLSSAVAAVSCYRGAYTRYLTLNEGVATFVDCTSQLVSVAETISKGRDVQSGWKRIAVAVNRLHDAASSLASISAAPTSTDRVRISSDSHTEVLELAFGELLAATKQLNQFVMKQMRQNS